VTLASVKLSLSGRAVRTADYLYLLFPTYKRKVFIKDLSGPVEIVDTIDNVIDSERDGESGKIDWSSLIDTMMSLGAFMTINIGIFQSLAIACT